MLCVLFICSQKSLPNLTLVSLVAFLTESKKTKRWAAASCLSSPRVVFSLLLARPSRTDTPSCFSASWPTTPRPRRRLLLSGTWVIRASALAPLPVFKPLPLDSVNGLLITGCLIVGSCSPSVSLLPAVQTLQTDSLLCHLRRKHFGFLANQMSSFGAVVTRRSLDFRPAAGWLTSPSCGRTGLHVSEPANFPPSFAVFYLYIHIYEHFTDRLEHWLHLRLVLLLSCWRVVMIDWRLDDSVVVAQNKFKITERDYILLLRYHVYASYQGFALCCPLLVRKCSALQLYSFVSFVSFFKLIYLDVSLPLYSVCLYFSMTKSQFCPLLLSI